MNEVEESKPSTPATRQKKNAKMPTNAKTIAPKKRER